MSNKETYRYAVIGGKDPKWKLRFMIQGHYVKRRKKCYRFDGTESTFRPDCTWVSFEDLIKAGIMQEYYDKVLAIKKKMVEIKVVEQNESKMV